MISDEQTKRDFDTLLILLKKSPDIESWADARDIMSKVRKIVLPYIEEDI